jgi:ATPase subunit of ABC transporter with duplicated ATPase domains
MEDLNSIERLESALNCYEGALLVISHDEFFLENTGIQDGISL